MFVGGTRDSDDGPVVGKGAVEVFDLVEGHMTFKVAGGFDGLDAVFLRSVCNPSNNLLVDLEFVRISSVILGHQSSFAKPSNLVDGCNRSEDILMIAKACQPNFNARSDNFAALDEHKLIGFREDQCFGPIGSLSLPALNGCH